MIQNNESNKKITLIITIVIFAIFFLNGQAKAWRCCGREVGYCQLASIGLFGSIIIGYFFAPYEKYTSTPSTTTFVSYYKNPVVNSEKYDIVPTIASHNAFTHSSKNTALSLKQLETVVAQNQILDIKEQLNYGVKTFLIDIYDTDKSNPSSSIKFSHGGYTFSKEWIPFLQEIYRYLSSPSNADEIITLHLESYVENYSKIKRDLINTKLDSYLYTPTTHPVNWDTRDNMIKSNARLLVFSDKLLDVGPGVMGTREYVLENDYEDSASQCTYRDAMRLKIPLTCVTTTTSNAYQCIENNTIFPSSSAGSSSNAIVFIMNHFAPNDKIHYFKRLFPVMFKDVVSDYYNVMNSYNVIKNKIEQCYCFFTIPHNSILQLPSGVLTKSTTSSTIKLEVHPNAIALDFIGKEPDRGIRGIIEDIIVWKNFTLPTC